MGILAAAMLLAPVLAFSDRIGISDPLSNRQAQPFQTPASPATSYGSSDEISKIFLPITRHPLLLPAIDRILPSTVDAQGSQKLAFLAGEDVRFLVTGVNNLHNPAELGLSWTMFGPCSEGQVFSDTLSIASGDWEHSIQITAPDCLGIYTASLEITYNNEVMQFSTPFVVNMPSAVVIDGHQGFDRCRLPSVQQMQTWWNSSPYWVFNLYLGGSTFACKDDIPDAVWVHAVARQGWTFIPTWVGPQAACTSFTNRMSSNPSTAYQQGRNEAEAAFQAAVGIGLLGEKVIYYDLEGFSGATSACRNAAASFMQGWTDRLHELGARAGGYGGSCSSYMTDWASNNPPPDVVWVANWTETSYTSNATVWDARCLSNSLWSNHERIRQYAGDHTEIWGGVSLRIDSNVLDGEVVFLPGLAAPAGTFDAPRAFHIAGPALRDMGLFSAGRGWVLLGNRLIASGAGETWRDVSPLETEQSGLLAATFLDENHAWMVLEAGAATAVLFTANGGETWQEIARITPLAQPFEIASLGFINAEFGWLSLRVQSGSSFSLGQLWVTEDGGYSWQERTLPLGEAVVFSDPDRAWVLGGATGEALYSTLDGGKTWRMASIEELESGISWSSIAHSLRIEPDRTRLSPRFLGALPALPEEITTMDFWDENNAWVVTRAGECVGEKTAAPLHEASQPLVCYSASRLWATTDAGLTWLEVPLPD